MNIDPCTRSVLLDPAFIAAATASVLAITGALGGIIVKLFAISRAAEARKEIAEETRTMVNGKVEARLALLEAMLAKRDAPGP